MTPSDYQLALSVLKIGSALACRPVKQACQAGLSSEIKTRFIQDFRKGKIRREEKREEERKRGVGNG